MPYKLLWPSLPHLSSKDDDYSTHLIVIHEDEMMSSIPSVGHFVAHHKCPNKWQGALSSKQMKSVFGAPKQHIANPSSLEILLFFAGFFKLEPPHFSPLATHLFLESDVFSFPVLCRVLVLICTECSVI
jgi:hypothetical protein